jgi:hypothetical protein
MDQLEGLKGRGEGGFREYTSQWLYPRHKCCLSGDSCNMLPCMSFHSVKTADLIGVSPIPPQCCFGPHGPQKAQSLLLGSNKPLAELQCLQNACGVPWDTHGRPILHQ